MPEQMNERTYGNRKSAIGLGKRDTLLLLIEPGQWFIRRELQRRAADYWISADTLHKDMRRLWNWGWLERRRLPTYHMREVMATTSGSSYRFPLPWYEYKLSAVGKEERAALLEEATAEMFS